MGKEEQQYLERLRELRSTAYENIRTHQHVPGLVDVYRQQATALQWAILVIDGISAATKDK